METTAQRPAVDIGPADNRAGLALGLAILSVPGSTVAWDLPAGGLWIGLPLGIAAIVIGLKARQRAGGSTMATVAIVIAGLMVAQMAIWTIVSLAS